MTGSEAPLPFGDPPRGLKIRRSRYIPRKERLIRRCGFGVVSKTFHTRPPNGALIDRDPSSDLVMEPKGTLSRSI
jgi:hypothetical protein